MIVAGVDGTKGGWVAVVLDGEAPPRVELVEGVASSFERLADAEVIAIDVPIGFGPRRADALARAAIGGSSVFAIPDRSSFEGSYGPGRNISAQAFAIGARIRHVTELAAADRRYHEVHPEVCFWAMNGGVRLPYRKKSARGALERLSLLERHGVGIDADALGDAAKVPLDDVLDAAGCAWSAARIARGEAASLPDPPEAIDGLRVAIWY